MEVTEGQELARKEVEGALLLVVCGDLTSQGVDVVVNPTNARLQHGGGVAHALTIGGGADVQRMSDEWVERNGPLGPGTAAVTGGGTLPAEHIIHVVGPRYVAGQDNERLLREAVRTALQAAQDMGASSLAMPAVSTGIFGYPVEEAADVIVGEVDTWLAQHPEGAVREVRLVDVDDSTADAMAAALHERVETNG